TRALPDIGGVQIQLSSSTAAGWLADLPPFSSAQYAYSGSVAYAVSSLSLRADFATPVTVTLAVNGGAPIALSSAVARDVPLAVGATEIILTGVPDGIYVYRVRREDVTLSALELHGYNAAGVQMFVPAVPAALTPAFTPRTQLYEL